MVTWVSGVAVGVGGVADVDLLGGGVAKDTSTPDFLEKSQLQCQLASVSRQLLEATQISYDKDNTMIESSPHTKF